MTNLIRRNAAASLSFRGEAWKTAGAEATAKATGGQLAWLRAECRDAKAEEAERPAGLGEVGRSQSPHHTAIRPTAGGEGRKAKPRRGKGGRKLEVRSLE